MAKRRVQQPPAHPATTAQADPLSIHALDRFSEGDLEQWKSLSADLDELHAVLYFEIHPQRMRRKQELIAALAARHSKPFEFNSWARIVDYRFTNSPLSAVGSMRGIGGRFNIGCDTDQSITPPFPALYLGDSHQTAYREKYQITHGSLDASGLTPEELGLARSHTWVRVRGSVDSCIDVSNPQNLAAVCKILAKIKLPNSVKLLMRRLKLGPKEVFMISSPSQLAIALQDENWRYRPTQFGIPSVSQQFADLVRESGFEGIVYRSSKNAGGKCLALFIDNLGSDRTFVELMDESPVGVVRRLDLAAAELNSKQ